MFRAVADEPGPAERQKGVSDAADLTVATQGQRWLALLMAAVSLIGLAACAAAVIASLVERGPTHNFDLYVRDSLPLLVIAIIWGAVGEIARRRRAKDADAPAGRKRRVPIRSSQWKAKAPLWTLYALLVATVATAAIGLSGGAPDSTGVGCRYTLKGPDGITCVSRQTYRDAGAAEQRFFAGVIGLLLAADLSLSITVLNKR